MVVMECGGDVSYGDISLSTSKTVLGLTPLSQGVSITWCQCQITVVKCPLGHFSPDEGRTIKSPFPVSAGQSSKTYIISQILAGGGSLSI